MKGAFVNITFASGDGSAELVAKTFLDSNNIFTSFLRWHLILKSIFKGKFIFCRYLKYFSGIL